MPIDRIKRKKHLGTKSPCCYWRIFLISGCLIAGFLCILILQKTVLPVAYIESMELYTKTHSKEILERFTMGRPGGNYNMIERDIEKATNSYKLPEWDVCIIGSDNNQVKISSFDARRKDETVRPPVRHVPSSPILNHQAFFNISPLIFNRFSKHMCALCTKLLNLLIVAL